MKRSYFFIKIQLLITITVLLSACDRNSRIHPVYHPIVDAVFSSGYIAMSDEYLVTANTEGFIKKQLVSEGDSVIPGKQLFLLSNDIQSTQLANAQTNYDDALRKADENSPQIQQMKLQIQQAEKQLDIDRRNFERYNDLVKSNAVSQIEFERANLQYNASQNNLEILEKSLVDLRKALTLNLQNARDQLKIQQENNEDYIISSSISGEVLNIYKNQGELVRRGETIAKIGGGETIIKLYIAEEDIGKISVGQKAIISLNTNKEKDFKGIIYKIYPAFDEQQQSFIAEALFIDQPTTLFPGTQLQANIIIAEKENALIIPSEYLLPGDSVMFANKTKAPIQVGIKNNEWIEVLHGLDTSDIITVNQ